MVLNYNLLNFRSYNYLYQISFCNNNMNTLDVQHTFCHNDKRRFLEKLYRSHTIILHYIGQEIMKDIMLVYCLS